MEQTLSPARAAASTVRLWLYAMAFLVFCMVIVGGATRLTDSGLSITEWRPLLGAIPPLNEADWQAAFEKYKLIPEYQIQNRGMPLSEFKFIYWWEWAHRFLGRFIGVAFALPLIFFTLTRRIDRTVWPRLLALFILGGLQGALGWYMVASGLVDRVDVSQYRLAAHLTLAAVIFAAIIWVAMGMGRTRKPASSYNDWFAVFLVALILLQIAAGGFVAGLDAGQGYATWPRMDGQWIPSGLWAMAPGWKNAFENAMTVQFNHRVLAYILLLAAAVHAWQCRTWPATILACAVFAQALLGILTLLLHVPLAAALIHQGGAMIVLALALWNIHARLVIRSPDPGPR
jgi:cytochrome c oxidase assembly protein subunit 15